MKDIIIVGAGGFGREVCSHVDACIRAGAKWRFKGFLDDNANAMDKLNYPAGSVMGGISEYSFSENDYCILAIASPALKKKLSENLRAMGAKFETLVHPTVAIGRNVKIGEGSVLTPFVVVTCDSEIGGFVTINSGCTVGHDTSIGDFSTLSCSCDVTGNVKLGEGVFFASNVTTVPGSKVGDWTQVGINSFAIGKLKPGGNYLGNPARPFM